MDELHVFKGQQLLGRYELHATELILGRAGHIVLDSPYISRLHALLSFHRERGYVITDLGARNGLRVNTQDASERELKTGDVIELGDFSIRCNFTGTGATMRSPPIAPRDGLGDTVELRRTVSPGPVVLDHPAVERAASSRLQAKAPAPPPKKDEPKKDEPKKEEAKKEEPKKEEPKKEEAKKPEAKKPDPPAKREAVGAEVKKVYDSYFKRLKRLARAGAEPTRADARPIQTDLAYVGRRHAWRSALRLSWLLAFLGCAVWLGGLYVRGKRQVFTSQSVSKGHEIFGNECAKCHVVPFSLGVPDPACLACHDGLLTKDQFGELEAAKASRWPTHHLDEGHTPACAECHMEHGGNPILARAVSDLSCTTCHADLAANVSAGMTLAVVTSGGRTIPSLARHVEFAALSRPDTAALSLDHARHLEARLPSMETAGRKQWIAETGRDHMVCADCHEPDTSRRYMRPIRYAEHCAKCHELEIVKEPSLPAAPIVHGIQPNVLVDYVRSLGIEAEVERSYESYLESHPDELQGTSAPPRRGPPGMAPPKPKAITRDEWLAKKMDRWRERGLDGITDDLLHAEAKNGCVKCHRLEGEGESLRVAPTRVPARWLLRSFFNHEKHRVVSCTECHVKAPESTKTEDVLIPGIQSCRGCHAPGGASVSCTTCHLYHDRGPDRRDMDGRVSRYELAPGLERKP